MSLNLEVVIQLSQAPLRIYEFCTEKKKGKVAFGFKGQVFIAQQ